MISEMKLTNDETALDWEWGQKYLTKSDKPKKAETNKMHLIRQCTKMRDRDVARLPYIGYKDDRVHSIDS